MVKPIGKLSILSPELENLTDFKIETYLTATAQPVFPSVLAVAKVNPPNGGPYAPSGTSTSGLTLEILHGEEAAGWRKMTTLKQGYHGPLLTQVQLVSPLLTDEGLTLKSLRDAAALLHAPLLLVYTETHSHNQGYNSAAIAYWSVVGLFTVPGNTVGHSTVCQAVLVDTRSGVILATAEGESTREENVLPGAIRIAEPRVEKQAKAEAIRELQDSFAKTLRDLAKRKG